MAWTTDDLAAVKRALTSGVRTVRFSDGRSVENQNAADLMAIHDRIAADLSRADEASCRTTYTGFARD